MSALFLRSLPRFLALSSLLSALGCGTALLPISQPIGVANTYTQHAQAGLSALEQWYSPSTGLYASPAGWWNAANSMTVLADYTRLTADGSYLGAISNTFTAAQTGSRGHVNFQNAYYDDQGWWALAWIASYDATRDPRYLAMAETIFQNLTTGWDSTCGGGIWWNTSRTYKNAIANELFLKVAASLANRVTDSSAPTYLTWAQREWSWFRASGMINAQNLINDGLNSSNPSACTNNNGIEWSYNQGVILGGLVELSRATADPSLIAQAQTLANATLASPLVNANGILIEHGVNGGDAPQFKGIFLRNLQTLYAVAPTPAYQAFARTNADSIWANDRNSANQFGALWQGPVDSTDATRQTSALDCLIAAGAMQ